LGAGTGVTVPCSLLHPDVCHLRHKLSAMVTEAEAGYREHMCLSANHAVETIAHTG
jgi:hypothetical protein